MITPLVIDDACEETWGREEERLVFSARADRLAMGPLAFWFLNHELEEAELLRQMEELKAKGFAGFFLHPRGGLRVPYGPQGSRRWREVIVFCVEQARALGLEAWLYDEDPYPSGTAGGRVTMERPDYRATELVPVMFPITEAGRVTVDLPEGALVAAYLVQDGVERIDEEAGLIRSKWRQFFSTAGYYPPYHAEGGPHWRAETAEPHYQITVDVPRAGGAVVAFVQRSTPQNPWGAYTDMLNAEAVQLFIRYTHDAYAELLGEECGAAVPGIFTDEAKLKGGLPWSARVPDWFREVAGCDLFEVLPHLVMKLNERTPFFRWAYRKALARGLRESMVEPMVAACRKHRLLLTGHVSPEEDPVGQVIYVPGLMGVIGRMDLPGTDLIGAAIGSCEQPLLHLSPKIASSAAHGYGKRWVTCEAFAVCDWSQDLASLTRATHWLYALGVNRLVTHGQFYSIDGLRKREAPPSQFIQAAYWEHFGGFSKMVELLSRELGSGVHVAQLLVYYPEESFMAAVSGMPGKQDEAYAMRETLGNVVHTLLNHGYDFDLADEELLLSVSGDEGRARLRDESFDVVVVPGRYLSVAAWERLRRLADDGVRVLYLEETMTVLLPQPQRWVTGGGWTRTWETIRSTVRPIWKAEGCFVAHQRKTDDGMLLFLCNQQADPFCGPVTVFFAGPYEVCHPQEGFWRSMERLELELGPGLGVLIRQQSGGAVRTKSKGEGEKIEAEWEEWCCTPRSENCLVISEFRVLHRSGKDEEWLPETYDFGAAPLVDLLSPTCLDSAVQHEAGDRYLLAEFDWRGEDAAVRLVCDTDLGEGEMTFFLNSHRLSPLVRRATYDPMNREVALAPFLRPGRNHLLWVQKRRGGDALPLPYDALRLFGDFHVEFPFGRPMPAKLTARPAKYRAGFPVAASQMGHPHYGGIVEYESRVTFSGPLPARVRLEVGHVYESMEVRINGRSAGCLWSKPWRVEIPAGWLKSGLNCITLACSCSPASYLQALQRPSGFLGPVRWSHA